MFATSCVTHLSSAASRDASDNVYYWDSPTNYITAQWQPTVEAFLCPTSPPENDAIGSLVYAMNGGSGLEAVSGTSVIQPRGDGVCFDRVGSSLGGANYPAKNTNLDIITGGDGASNTLLLAEKCGVGVTTQMSLYGLQFAMTHSVAEPETASTGASWTLSAASPKVVLLPGGAIPQTSVINQTNEAYRYPSSNHPGGANVVFADGHTAFLQESVQPNVYCQLMTSNSTAGTNPPLSKRVLSWGLPPLNSSS